MALRQERNIQFIPLGGYASTRSNFSYIRGLRRFILLQIQDWVNELYMSLYVYELFYIYQAY